MGEAKAKMKEEMATAVLPDEIRPSDDNLLLRLVKKAEQTRGGLILPHNMVLAMKQRSDAVKRQFGTIVEQPRMYVIAVGPDVKQYEAGDEVMVHRKAIAFDGTAVNVTGFGVHFFCKEQQIIAKIVRFPEDEAQAIYEAYARAAEKEDEGPRGAEDDEESVLVKPS